MLGSLIQAIGDQIPDHAPPDSTATTTNAIEGIHQHLQKVFSLRSHAENEQENDFERDSGLSSFFLPTQEEGLNFVRCFFEHVRQTFILPFPSALTEFLS